MFIYKLPSGLVDDGWWWVEDKAKQQLVQCEVQWAAAALAEQEESWTFLAA